jgi:hypothetical protein
MILNCNQIYKPDVFIDEIKMQIARLKGKRSKKYDRINHMIRFSEKIHYSESTDGDCLLRLQAEYGEIDHRINVLSKFLDNTNKVCTTLSFDGIFEWILNGLSSDFALSAKNHYEQNIYLNGYEDVIEHIKENKILDEVPSKQNIRDIYYLICVYCIYNELNAPKDDVYNNVYELLIKCELNKSFNFVKLVEYAEIMEKNFNDRNNGIFKDSNVYGCVKNFIRNKLQFNEYYDCDVFDTTFVGNFGVLETPNVLKKLENCRINGKFFFKNFAKHEDIVINSCDLSCIFIGVDFGATLNIDGKYNIKIAFSDIEDGLKFTGDSCKIKYVNKIDYNKLFVNDVEYKINWLNLSIQDIINETVCCTWYYSCYKWLSANSNPLVFFVVFIVFTWVFSLIIWIVCWFWDNYFQENEKSEENSNEELAINSNVNGVNESNLVNVEINEKLAINSDVNRLNESNVVNKFNDVNVEINEKLAINSDVNGVINSIVPR